LGAESKAEKQVKTDQDPVHFSDFAEAHFPGSSKLIFSNILSELSFCSCSKAICVPESARIFESGILSGSTHLITSG
jgi:hypothetical protein